MIDSVLKINAMADEQFSGQKNDLFFKSLRHGFTKGYIAAMNPREDTILHLMALLENEYKNNLIAAWSAAGESYSATDLNGHWEMFKIENQLVGL